MTKEEIDKLLKRRDQCRTSINRLQGKTHLYDKARQYAEEYQRITQILNENGRRLDNNNQRFHPETYAVAGSPKDNIIVDSGIKEDLQPKNTPVLNKHIISLAWTESPSQDISNTIDKIKEYFDDLGIEAVEQDDYNSGAGIEHKIKYEFEGDERSFKILKYSAQFLLDTISNTDYEKFNIAIFGKKQLEESKPEKTYSLEDEVRQLKKEVDTLKKALNSLLPIDQRI